ncbi:MAG: RNA methyltransferase [Lysobacteraceae bacterium]
MNKHVSDKDGSRDCVAEADVRIVMVGTQHPGNIGAAARAMKTMGLRKLVLVAPHKPAVVSPDAFRQMLAGRDDLPASREERWDAISLRDARVDHPDTLAMAVGADDILASAQICETLEEALADCRFVAGCTARARQVMLPECEPREAATKLLDAAGDGAVALVFGPERSGLTNEDLQRCHIAVHIPTNPDFSSLNLAAAVQVLSYEMRLAMLARTDIAKPALARDEMPAEQAEMEAFFTHFEQMLHAIDFHKGRSPETVQRRLRAMFLRAQPASRELRILRGIFADAERMARLAGQGTP